MAQQELGIPGTPVKMAVGDFVGLTQELVARAVVEVRQNGFVSLRALRVFLKRYANTSLVSCKALIRRMAEEAVNSWVAPSELISLPQERIAELRNPYVGIWEPCHLAAACRPSAVPPRGMLLFTMMHDLDVGSFRIPGHRFWSTAFLCTRTGALKGIRARARMVTLDAANTLLRRIPAMLWK